MLPAVISDLPECDAECLQHLPLHSITRRSRLGSVHAYTMVWCTIQCRLDQPFSLVIHVCPSSESGWWTKKGILMMTTTSHGEVEKCNKVTDIYPILNCVIQPFLSIFCVPRVCRRTLGERSSQYIGPVIWNSLPFFVRHATSLSSFKSKLKIHLFSSAYYHFLSSVSIKPMTTMFVFLQVWVWVLRRLCVCVGGWVGGNVCILKWMCLSAFVSALGSHEVGHHKIPFIIIIILTLSTICYAKKWRNKICIAGL